MANKLEDVIGVIVEAIKSIGKTDLGFDEAPNVHDYFLEYEDPSQVMGYLKASVRGKKVVKAWAVDGVEAEDPEALDSSFRRFIIRIRGYYDLQRNGDGVRELRRESRAVRRVLQALTLDLGKTVHQWQSGSSVEVNVVDSEVGGQGKMLTWTWELAADSVAVDW